MNGKVFAAKLGCEVHYGKIECTGFDEYHFYNDGENGIAIAKLNSVEVAELIFTGEVIASEDLIIIIPEHFYQ